jgi:hypothetical protein
MSDSTVRKRGGRSDNLFKHGGFVDLFTESGVFLLKSLLSSFAVIDIRARNLLAHDLSLVVAHGIVRGQEPAMASITFAHPHF